MMLDRLFKEYIFSSFRRQKIDKELEKAKPLFKGRVLDIGGGREKGEFNFPAEAEVIVVDINKQSKPDIVADVAKLPFKDHQFDVIKATELFEHVSKPEKGIEECLRVLRPGGYFILSMPFLCPVHADPSDYQRWTETKLRTVFRHLGVKIKKFKIQGYYLTVLADYLKNPILNLPFFIRYPAYLLFFPLLYTLVFLDDRICSRSQLLKKYHSGYFIVLRKNE